MNLTSSKNWKTIPAETFCIKVADGTHDSPKQSTEGKFLVTSKNIKNGILDTSSSYKISEDDFYNINKRSKVDQWDILFSMIGTVGEVCVIKEEPDFAIKNVGLFKCGDKTKALFLYYYLLSNKGKEIALSLHNGTTQRYITLGELRTFKILAPESTEEQKEIAEMLGSLDDKIELLRKENKTLEDIAQTLFKEWFVDFNFPGGAGKMTDSELGEIPEGWKVETLGKEANEIVRGFTTEYVEKSNLINLNQKVNKGNYLDKQYFKYYPNETVVPNNKFIKKYDILLNSLGEGTLGRIYLYREDTNDVIADQHITILRFPSDLIFYIYQVLISDDGQFRLMNGISGSTGMLMLNINMVRNFSVIIPKDEILNSYSSVCVSLYEKIANNEKQFESLLKLRDELLNKIFTN